MSEPDIQAQPQWLTLGERGSRLGMRIVAWTVTVFGRSAARALLWPIISYYFISSARARRASRDFLRRADQPGGWHQVFRHLLCLGQCTVDRLFFVKGQTDLFEIESRYSGFSKELDSLETGALILGAHLGSFEALSGMGREEGLDVVTVVDTRNARMLQGILADLNPGLSDRLLEMHSGGLNLVFRIKERLQRGQHVAMLADRCTPGARSVEVPFLGEDASFPTSAFALAATVGCPVYLSAGLYLGSNRYLLHAELLTERVELPRGDRDAALRRCVAHYASRLEALVREVPLNWFNFYDFWSKTGQR